MRRKRWIALAMLPALIARRRFLLLATGRQPASDRVRGLDYARPGLRLGRAARRHYRGRLAGRGGVAGVQSNSRGLRHFRTRRVDPWAGATRQCGLGCRCCVIPRRIDPAGFVGGHAGWFTSSPAQQRPVRPVSAGRLRLRLTFRLNAAPRAVDLDAGTLVVSIPGHRPISIGHVGGHADLTQEAGRDQAVVNFSASAQPVTLPDDVHFKLGSEISEFALDGVLNGPWPPRQSAGSPDLAERATAWRDAGGSLELSRVSIAWGPARLDATATLALDEDLQPMGAGTGKIAGYDAVLDAMADDAILTRSAATAAKAVLLLLADTPADGEPAQVEVPLTLQFRTLSVHQVPLTRLPELDWPEHQAGGPGVLSR